jgi:hypothetical protein
LGTSSREVGGMNQSQLDSVMLAHSIGQTALNRYIMRQMARVGSPERGEFAHFLVKGISYMMFALMPVFAIAVYVLNRKKARHYIGTLVFSLHYHSVVFLLLSVLVIVNRLIDSYMLWFFPFVFLPVYLFLSLGSVYKDSWLVVLFKSILINIFHVVSLVVVFIITVLVSLLIF